MTDKPNRTKEIVTTTISPNVLKRLKDYCAEQERPLNFYLEKWIDKELTALGK